MICNWICNILIGKILSPKIHTINVPGNETIVVEGKVKVDKNGTPYLAIE